MGDPRDRQTPAAPAQHDPWDIDLEFSVLGSMLKDNSQIDIAAADLTAETFYDPMLGRIFDLVVVLMADGEAVTPLVVHSVMKTDPGLIVSGGMDFLNALVGAAPAIPAMRTWIRLLQDLALRRQLLKISQALADSATAPPSEMTARQSADAATEALLLAGRASAKPIRSLREIAMDSIHEIEDVRAGRPVPIIPSGIEKLDKEIGGFRGSDLIVIPAKSGMGKTSLLAAFAINAARAGYPTIFFSLEMTERQLAERMMADIDFGTHEKALWYSKVRNHRLNDDEFARYVLAAQSTDGWPIEICDDAGMTMQQISAKARAFKAKHGNKLGLVVGDYFQLVEPADNKEPRERQVNRIAWGAKCLAKLLDWPNIWGSQMNEDDKSRAADEKRPRGTDVRESKGIQFHADQMFSPWRPAYWVERRKPMDAMPGDIAWNTWAGDLREVRHRFDLLTLKNRHGREMDYELWCDMAASAIRNEAPEAQRKPEDQAAADLLTNIG